MRILPYPLLVLGIAIVLFPPIMIDVNMRLAYWEGRADYPNMDPRIMYTIFLFILAGLSILASMVEIIRGWVLGLRPLKWWQALIIGGSYSVFFSGLALRHYLDPRVAFYVPVIAVVIFNPVTGYFMFKLFSKNAP